MYLSLLRRNLNKGPGYWFQSNFDLQDQNLAKPAELQHDNIGAQGQGHAQHGDCTNHMSPSSVVSASLNSCRKESLWHFPLHFEIYPQCFPIEGKQYDCRIITECICTEGRVGFITWTTSPIPKHFKQVRGG